MLGQETGSIGTSWYVWTSQLDGTELVASGDNFRTSPTDSNALPIDPTLGLTLLPLVDLTGG